MLAYLTTLAALAQDAYGSARLVALSESLAHPRDVYVVAIRNDLAANVTVYEDGRAVLADISPDCRLERPAEPRRAAETFVLCRRESEERTLLIRLGDPPPDRKPSVPALALIGARGETAYVWHSSSRDLVIELPEER